MAYNFPDSPSNGATVTVNGVTYTYNSTLGVWSTAAANTTFVGLADTPANFSSAGGKTVKVNSGATALEFVTDSGGGGGGGVTSYANFASFPGSPTEGDLAYAEDTNALYIYDGAEWDRISSGNNELPEFTTEPAGSYNLATDGTATTVTVAATDPEGFDITYSHDTSPSSQNQATITNNGGTFTITPSTNTGYAGTFNLRFKASDGVHVSSKTSAFTLGFSTEWFGQYYISDLTTLYPRDVAVDSNDNIYTVGYINDTSIDTIGYISKINKYGTLLWTKTLESTETSTTETQFRSIVIDGSDNIYVGGWFVDGGALDNRPILVKYNTSGALQFAKKYYPSQSVNYPNINVAVSPDGNGVYFSWRTIDTQISGGTQYFYTTIFKTNSSGTIQWLKAVGYPGGNELGAYLGLEASNSYVYFPLRSNVENDGGATPYTYNGIGALHASTGNAYFARYMNDAERANIGGTNPTILLDGSNVVALHHPVSSQLSGATDYAYGIFSVTTNAVTNTNQTKILHVTTRYSPDQYARLDSYQGGGRIVKDDTYYYAPLNYYGSDIATAGERLMFAGLPISGTTYRFRGHLATPSNTSGGGIHGVSFAKTSEGRIIALARLSGDSVASGTTHNMILLSFDPELSRSSTTLGVNSNITLSTATPGTWSNTTNTAANFTGTSRAGTFTSTTPNTFTESTLSNTAGTDTLTSDVDDIS